MNAKSVITAFGDMRSGREALPVLGPPSPPPPSVARNKSSDDNGEPQLHDRNLNAERHVRCSRAYALEKELRPRTQPSAETARTKKRLIADVERQMP